jgi:UDP-N-acetylmuramyl tripeptide synthase
VSLAEQLQALVEQHDLTSLSIDIHRRDDGTVFFASFAHAGDLCGHSSGSENRASPAAAMTASIKALNEKRTTTVSIHELECAA